jgi:hypothetical protein
VKAEEAKAYIERELKERLQSFIGQTHDPEKIRQTVLDSLSGIYKNLGLGPTDDETTALSELVAVGFLGMPEDFDPKKIVGRLRDHTLDMLVDRLGGTSFPTNLLTLEWMKRKGNIVDWTFTRTDSQGGNVEITPKKHLNLIQTTFLVDPEDKN